MAKLNILGSSSKGNCYILESEDETLILDAGVAQRTLFKELNTKKNVVGCLLTHSHKDHSKSYRKLIEKGVSVYTSNGVKSELEGQEGTLNTFVEVSRGFPCYQFGKFLVLPFQNNHTHNDERDCPCLGFLIQHKEFGKVLFATDTYKLDFRFDNVDHILIECNYAENIIVDKEDAQERVVRSHMSLENLIEYLKKWDLTNTKDITLLHLSERNGDKDLFKQEVEAATGKTVIIADKGVVLDW